MYEYKLTDTVADDATAEYMQSYMEENILSAFSDDFNSSDLVQEAARAGYTFRYRGVDQNGRQIYNVNSHRPTTLRCFVSPVPATRA